jgi:hypothetical protein
MARRPTEQRGNLRGNSRLGKKRARLVNSVQPCLPNTPTLPPAPPSAVAARAHLPCTPQRPVPILPPRAPKKIGRPALPGVRRAGRRPGYSVSDGRRRGARDRSQFPACPPGDTDSSSLRLGYKAGEARRSARPALSFRGEWKLTPEQIRGRPSNVDDVGDLSSRLARLHLDEARDCRTADRIVPTCRRRCFLVGREPVFPATPSTLPGRRPDRARIVWDPRARRVLKFED